MKRWLKRLAAACALLVLALAGFCAWQCRHPPSDREIRSRLSSHYSPRGRTRWVPLSAISPKLQAAVIDWEDPMFYAHHGLVFPQIWEAAMADIRAGRYVRGGSTITQQVAKNLFLTPKKTLRRKLREAVLAVRIEHTIPKAQILEVYLNVAQWGDGFAGAEEASQTYFGKPASALSWDEAALLAGILPNPHLYNPLKDPQEAHRRRDAVLKVLVDDGDLSGQEYLRAVSTPCCAASGVDASRPAIQRAVASIRVRRRDFSYIETPIANLRSFNIPEPTTGSSSNSSNFDAIDSMHISDNAGVLRPDPLPLYNHDHGRAREPRH